MSAGKTYEDPWRYRCPNGHNSWQARQPNGLPGPDPEAAYYCEVCGPFDELVDAKELVDKGKR